MERYLTKAKITRNGVSKEAGRMAVNPVLMKIMGVGIGDTLGIRKEGEFFVVEKVATDAE